MKNKVHQIELWPTTVRIVELVSHPYDQELVAIVKEGCAAPRDVANELRFHDLGVVDHQAVRWLKQQMIEQAEAMVGFPVSSIDLRGVLLLHGNHIVTHTEQRESDLGIAYWPSGREDAGGWNNAGDGVNEPTFIFEDPSRHFSDLRLPYETRHSVYVKPRPGAMALFPAHLPHNMHPFLGEAFVHIVAQVRFRWPSNYFRI